MIAEWFGARLSDAGCRVEPMPVARSRDWSVREGALVHRSGGFFKVVGVRWKTPEDSLVERPFLEQREIGTLGFLTRAHEGRSQLLVQAKIEPGNVGLVQLAPTCQATDSNARRLHGGAAPPFVESFPPAHPDALNDVAQSEQGSRFLGKRNRNVLVRASGEEPLLATHRWVDVDAVLDLLLRDYVVNTDARSVLVCAPWPHLVIRAPFSRHACGIGAEFRTSLLSSSRHVSIPEVKERVARLRASTEDPKIVGLHELPSWRFNEEGFSRIGGGGSLRVRHVGVRVNGREVPAWDQPIVDSASEGTVLLACGRLDGVLHFLFRARPEPGLFARVELTPTVVVEPGASAATDTRLGSGRIVAEVRQSEEGGRFHRDTNVYRIVDVGEAGEAGKDSFWLTLGDVRQLLDEPGWLTNEARSALSLLLPWM